MSTLYVTWRVPPSPSASEAVLEVGGEIDLLTAGDLAEAFWEARAAAVGRVVVDLAGVVFADASCLRVLIEADRTLANEGGTLVLRRLSTAMSRLLAVAALDGAFTIDGDRAPPPARPEPGR